MQRLLWGVKGRGVCGCVMSVGKVSCPPKLYLPITSYRHGLQILDSVTPLHFYNVEN